MNLSEKKKRKENEEITNKQILSSGQFCIQYHYLSSLFPYASYILHNHMVSAGESRGPAARQEVSG